MNRDEYVTNKAQPVDILILVGLSIMWSSSFVFIKVAVETIPPITISAGRITFAALLLGLFMIVRKEKLPTDPRSWLYFLMLGCIGNGLPFFLISWGEIRVDSSVAAILIAASPLSSFIIGHLVTTDERLNLPRTVGVVIGFIGIIMLIGPESILALGEDAVSQLAIVGGAICYVCSSFIARRMPPMSQSAKSTGTMIVATFVMIPMSLLIDQPWTLAPTTEAFLSVAYLGLFSTAIASLMLFFLISRVGATFLSLNNYINPILGIAWGYFLVSEVPTLQTWAGLGLILAGLIVTQFRRRVRASA